MRTLHLTSPLTRGDDVRAAQVKLGGLNALGKAFYRGKVDGQFGPATAQAAKRAKYVLGYALKDVTPIYGDQLHGYLAGRKTTIAMRLRARSRAKAATATPMRVKAWNFMHAHLGDKEFPAGSNRVPWASEWYGVIGPWCAMSVTRAYVDGGSKAFVRGSRYAYVPFILADAHGLRNGLSITTKPQKGDLVLYDWDNDGTPDHVGLFTEWTSTTAFRTIEGNTAIGNNSNGGEVMVRDRSTSDVAAFVHVSK
jgi:hypothetical protein